MNPISTQIKLSIVAIFLLFSPFAIGQKKFAAFPANSPQAVQLRTHFSKYALFTINTADIVAYSRSQANNKINFELDLPGFANWKFSISEHDILSKDYTLVINSPEGKTVLPRPACMTYTGYLSDISKSKVRLTIDNDVIYGIIKSGDTEYFIEPLRYINNQAPADVFVVYDTKDVVVDASLTCGVTETKRRSNSLQKINAGSNCIQTQLAIASDASMFTRYGSATAVQTHNIGVMNNVMWDYVNAQFDDNIEFVIVTQNVSTSAVTDQLLPAETGTDSYVILDNFTAWGQAGNFGTTYDLAQFWTTRNIDVDGAGTGANTIGLAWIGAVCSSLRYHILEDFTGTNPTGSGYQLRVLTTHEIGHNFDCDHDTTNGFIMSPSVGNTSTWSPASVTFVDNYTPLGCLSNCDLAGAPIADFITAPDAICTGSPLQLIDHSLRGPTSWSWTMTGGSPTTSTVRNPTVSYATTGVKTISLTSANSGGTSSQFSRNIFVSNSPAAACINSGAIGSNAGLKFFGLNKINRSSGGASADGNKYMDFSCTDITDLAASTLYTATFTIGDGASSTPNTLTFYIDYNNDGDFNDVDELVFTLFPSGGIGTGSFDFTTPASPVTNQFLRARVVAKDFIVVADNPCHNPNTGQVEDYSVYFASGVSLPVTLIDFNGYHNNGVNVLTWETANEKDNSYFEIERSIDGITFESIGTKAGAVNSSSINRYNFTDPLAGGFANYSRLYYRLKTVDLSGHAEYSKIISITITSIGSDLVLNVQPNPFTNNLAATIRLKNAEMVSLQLIDMTGRVIYQNQRNLDAGIHTITCNNFDRLSKGTYIIKITSGHEIVSRLVEKR